MKKSFTKLIREELVKRFESVVQEEIKEHQKEIERTRCAYSEMKESFESLKAEIKDIRREMRESLQTKKEEMQKEMREIESSFDKQRRLIRKNIKDVEFFLGEINNKISGLVNCKEFNQYRNEMAAVVGSIYRRIEDEKDQVNNKVHEASNNMKHDVRSLEMKAMKLREDQQEDLKRIREQVETYIIDEQGFEKEMKVLKKSVFILEKKAESLYTLFEGIKNKVEF